MYPSNLGLFEGDASKIHNHVNGLTCLACPIFDHACMHACVIESTYHHPSVSHHHSLEVPTPFSLLDDVLSLVRRCFLRDSGVLEPLIKVTELCLLYAYMYVFIYLFIYLFSCVFVYLFTYVFIFCFQPSIPVSAHDPPLTSPCPTGGR